ARRSGHARSAEAAKSETGEEVMALDPIDASAPVPSVADTTAAAAVPAASASAPSLEGAASSAPSSAPAAAPSGVPESEATSATTAPAAAGAEPKLDSDTPTLLEQFDKDKAATDAKPAADAKPDADKPKAEGDKAAAEAKPAEPAAKPEGETPPAVAPIAYEYALPESIKMDDAQRGELHAALDAFRADPAKGAQSLIDLHNKSMQAFAEQTVKDQRQFWADTN